ncbi:MAG: cellulase family glycosylhydrolase [Candidatus Omnitrophica bacterium]|nr:cellulase family glycosylhydrolase [Candidatus Omnitrophota bacterium]
MRRIGYSLFIAALFTASLSNTGDCGTVTIKNLSKNKAAAAQYELFEIKAVIGAPYKNAFDPAEIQADVLVDLENGAALTVPGFYSGKGSLWLFRYTPVSSGSFSYRLSVRTPSGTSASAPCRVNVLSTGKDGFLRKGSRNPFYPVFDSGRPFFGIGHNIGWVTNNKLSAYETYFKEFRKSGCNLVRIWINNPWSLAIEDAKTGQYNLENCEKLDSLMRMAEKYGIYVILVLDSYASLMKEPGKWGEGWWKSNPYNKANGGPCAEPWDFFTDNEAKRYYRDRLRYIIARWGYSPNILAFQLWNETNAPEKWTRETLAYFKALNPHGQLMTTSLGYPWGDDFDEPAIWELRDLDVIDRHVYGDQAGGSLDGIISLNKEYSIKYGKMLLVGEFGISADQTDRLSDPKGSGAALHTSMWACAMTRSFAGSLNWWWAEYVKAKNLYPHYRALRDFVSDIDWNAKSVGFARLSSVTKISGRGKNIVYGDVLIPTREEWGPVADREFLVANSGEMPEGSVNAYLHGKLHEEMRVEPVFHVDYPADGKFIIQIGTVSAGGKLVVYLDDKDVLLEKDLPAGPGDGPWKKSLYRKDVDLYQCKYDMPLEIDIPAGKHTIRLANKGRDWIGIRKITLTNYKSDSITNARAVGLNIDGTVILWAYNRDYDWENPEALNDIKPMRNTPLTVSGIANGTYRVEWWDTLEGKVIKRERASARNGLLQLKIPQFTKDIACKIRR